MKEATLNRRWEGQTVVCIASGPSLTLEDVDFVQKNREAGACRTIVVNREFLVAPWADVLYMADLQCWRVYIDRVRKSFKGELWTVDASAAHTYKLNLVKRGFGKGYSLEANTINSGGNSGFQAVHLAASWGAKRIILLGYDMQRTNGKPHHYGKHDGSLPNGKGFAEWLSSFKPLVMDLDKLGVGLINATRISALPEKWIPRSSVQEIL